MKKIAFIIPYFGHFNNYFPLFLNSCRHNPDTDWIIFTDDHTGYPYPDNVIVKYTTFSAMADRIRSSFDFTVSLDYPYKLCDFRPAYGYIFSDELKGYDLWGYCDSDLIWGDISRFITDDIADRYDKIGIYGHCTLFKNTEENNTMFMRPLDGALVYRQVLKEPSTHSFDEEFNASINNIFEEYGKKIYYDLKLANVYTKSSDFRLTYLDESHHRYIVEKKKKAFFVWNRGRLMRYEKHQEEVTKTEYLYIHMQSRRMKVNVSMDSDQYKIIPNSFDDMEVSHLGAADFDRVRIKHPNLHYFRLRSKNLMVKIRRMLRSGR